MKKSQSFPFFGKYHFGWASFLALGIMLIFALCMGMDESIRNFPLEVMFAFGLFAFFSGWVISGNHSQSKLKFISGLFIGLILLLVFNSDAYRNIYLAFINGFRLNRLFEPFKRYLIDLDLFIYFFQNSIVNLFHLGEEIYFWITNIIKGQTSSDPKLIEIFWGTILWQVTFSSGWLFRRKNHAFIAGLPIMTLLIGILGYTRQTTSGITLGIFALLMMIIVLEHLRYEDKWDSHKIDYSDQLRLDIAFISIPIILAILLVANVLPNIPYDAIKEFYDRFRLVEGQNQSYIDNNLGLMKTPEDLSYQPTSGILPRELLIGSGSELSEKVIMEISTGEVFLPPEIDHGSTLPSYYWFGRSYDIYTGNGWKTSEFYQKNYTENEIITSSDLKNSRSLNLEIEKTRIAPETLFVSGVPQSVDHKVVTFWREATNEYYSAQIDALEYTVKSQVLVVTEENFRQSLGNIPEEILNTYLQIPEGTPDRIGQLALSLTDGIQNSYDKAKAIETYLRQFEYTLDIPKPNPDQDVVDFFLFDLKKGYCDYFASAMVILSRSIGLPARLAVGYTTGTYDYSRNIFVVSEANAHAWPEIYIPPYGWVPFEPTASQTPFAWNVDQDFQRTLESEIVPADHDTQVIPFWKNFLILLIILVTLIIMGSIWYKIAFHKTKSIPSNQYIERIYQKMKRQITSHFIPPQPSKTPLELQRDLLNYFKKQESSQLIARLTNPIAKNLTIITEIYIKGIYSPLPITPVDINIARKNLYQLLQRSWLLNLINIFRR